VHEWNVSSKFVQPKSGNTSELNPSPGQSLLLTEFVIPTAAEGSRAVCGAHVILFAAPLMYGHPATVCERRIQGPCKRQFLASPPALDLLLALDGGKGIINLLVIDEALDLAFSGETPEQSVFMFVCAAFQIGGNPNVHDSTTARQDIDVKPTRGRPDSNRG
jgi:hypothetical protein